MKSKIFLSILLLGSIHNYLQAQITGSKKLDIKKIETAKTLKFSGKFRVNAALSQSLRASVMGNNKKKLDGVYVYNRIVSVDERSTFPKAKNTSQQSSSNSTCTTYKTSISSESQDFNVPYGLQASNIYPGAAYMRDEYLKNSVSPKIITWKRNPIYIQVSSSSGNGNYEFIENPTSITLNAAVGKLKSGIRTNTNESTSIKMYATYSNNDFAFRAGAGGGGFGYNVQAHFGLQNSTKKSRFVIDETQTSYTIQASLPEGEDNVSFFADAQLDKTPGALFISNVSYGRRVMAVVEVENTSENIKAGLKASYTGVGWNAGIDINMLNKMEKGTVTVKMYYVGGLQTKTETPDIFSNNSNSNTIGQAIVQAINKFKSETNAANAVPIRFNFRDMSMTGQKYQTATDEFTYEVCEERLTLRQASLQINTGQDDKNDNSELWISLGTGNEHNTNWVGQIFDKSRTFNSKGNPWTLTFPNTRPMTYQELLERGGIIAFKMIAHSMSGNDDWNISSLSLYLDFVNDEGKTVRKTYRANGFTLSRTKDSKKDSKQLFFTAQDLQDK